MQSAAYWIKHLQLEAHPEGGFYRETYRSAESVDKKALPSRFPDQRSFSTAIYFLLRSQDRSVFHRIKSDELWHFHEGSALSIYVLNDRGLTLHTLGRQIELGQSLQVAIPANTWFGAMVNDQDSYTLAGCTVSPGFHYDDFKIAERQVLLQAFPHETKIIEMLTSK